MMIWRKSWRCDPRARVLADRHYSRQSHGAPNFVPPGRCLVLWAPGAYWVTSWPFAEYVLHDWAGDWVCSAFRRESSDLPIASMMIRSAVAATRFHWPDADTAMITFVDPSKVRRKRDAGRCFLRAGFRHVGYTRGGLLAFRLATSDMPEPEPPCEAQLSLFAGPHEDLA